MSKKKLFDDIKHDPARIYRAPADVLRDRRFADAERLEILQAWRNGNRCAGEIDTALDAALAEVHGRLGAATGHAAE